jgi:hypothetical protein
MWACKDEHQEEYACMGDRPASSPFDLRVKHDKLWLEQKNHGKRRFDVECEGKNGSQEEEILFEL